MEDYDVMDSDELGDQQVEELQQWKDSLLDADFYNGKTFF